MLADRSHIPFPCGKLDPDVLEKGEFVRALLQFIVANLTSWRDSPDRPRAESETILTGQLCEYLNSASRRTKGWDALQFRTEVADELHQGRKLDLVAKPCNAVIFIDGRRHTEFDSLLPIECKRLPTPKDHKRDEREYVFSSNSSTGGIQRFKAGHHGASHTHAAMIAYIQEENAEFWAQRISEWISRLAESGTDGWTDSDGLFLTESDPVLKVAVLRSRHARIDQSLIDLQHLWLQMN